MSKLNNPQVYTDIESVTLETAAKIIGRSPKTIYNWRYRYSKGEKLDLPNFYRNTKNGQLHVRVAELKKWIKRLERNSSVRKQGRPRKSKSSVFK